MIDRRWAAAALGTWLVPALALGQAPTGQTVGAFPLSVEGKLDDEGRARLEASVSEGLGRAGFSVVDSATVAESAGVTSCDSSACYADAARAAGTDFVVRTSVAVSGREYEISAELFDGKSGDSLARVDDSCQLCGLEEAAELMADVASAMQREVESFEQALPPHLIVHSVPEGADVYIDGKAVGKTPVDVEVEPGKHAVRVSAKGYLAEDREVVLLPDVRQRLALNLEKDTYLLKALGATGVALGVATTASGAAILALDKRPNRLRCSGEDIDFDGDCRFRYNTLAGGLAMTLGGMAVLAAVGITALVLQDRKKRSAEQAGLRLTPTLDGVSVRF